MVGTSSCRRPEVCLHSEDARSYGSSERARGGPVGAGRQEDFGSLYPQELSECTGIHLAEDHIDLGKTMGELGIDDNAPGLTTIEKQATILDLLRSRSG